MVFKKLNYIINLIIHSKEIQRKSNKDTHHIHDHQVYEDVVILYVVEEYDKLQVLTYFNQRQEYNYLITSKNNVKTMKIML